MLNKLKSRINRATIKMKMNTAHKGMMYWRHASDSGKYNQDYCYNKYQHYEMLHEYYLNYYHGYFD